MASVSGYVDVDEGAAVDPGAAITAWEAEANIDDCVVVGGIGAKTTVVADEISNGMVKFKVTTADPGVATDITDDLDSGDVITGAKFKVAKGESAPA